MGRDGPIRTEALPACGLGRLSAAAISRRRSMLRGVRRARAAMSNHVGIGRAR
jgi:hypothetical protein